MPVQVKGFAEAGQISEEHLVALENLSSTRNAHLLNGRRTAKPVPGDEGMLFLRGLAGRYSPPDTRVTTAPQKLSC